MTDGYIEITKEESYVSENFVSRLTIGTPLLMGNAYDSEVLVPLKGDALNAAADFENRSEYYYDAASVKTQGGNIDYGLRQYVSAVEFKAGPLSNPHAARVQSGRATGTILSVEPIMNGSVYTGFAHLIMSQEDVDKFPSVERQPNAINADYEWEMGQAHYSLEIDSNIFVYFGEGNKNKSTLVSGGLTPTDSLDTLSSIIVMTKENNTIPSYLKNDTLKGETATLTKYGYDVFFSSDKYNTKLDNTVNKSHTGRAAFYSSPWEITGIAGSDKELSLESETKSQLIQADRDWETVLSNFV